MNGRAWKIVLVGSLVLNAFLVGAIVGGAFRWFTARGTEQAVQTRTQQPVALRFAAQALSPERQEQFVDGLKAARRDARQYAREGREGRREILRLLAAPQLDRPAIDAALARTRDADIALRTQVEASVVDFAATLSPQERQQFVEGLRARGQWREAPPAAAASAPPASGE
jgi:uncharacterized membrane protein